VRYLIGYSSALKSTTQNYEYLQSSASDWQTNVIYDIADASGTPLIGQVKAWGPFGTIITEDAPETPPVTLPYAYKHVPETVDHPVFLDFPMFVSKNTRIYITIYCKLHATGMTSRPKFQILDPKVSWDVSSPASTLAEVQAADTTDWQTLSIYYAETVEDRQIVLRCEGKDATNYWHWMYSVSRGEKTSVFVN